MSNILHRAAKELFNKPLLVEPGYAETLASVVGTRMGVDNSALSAAEYEAREPAASSRPGVEVISIIGSMTHRASFMDAASGMASYKEISARIEEAKADGSIHTVVLEIDSPGGSVSGAFDLADKIYGLRESKRVIAFVDGMAASAGYLLASQATTIHATQTSQVGSIGVVMMHVDRSQQLENEGVKPTFIFAGDHKVDGNSTEPLPAGVKKRFQAEIDEAYGMFVAAVDRGRRGMSQDDIRGTEALMFSAQSAIDAGLVDKVTTLEQTMTEAFMEPITAEMQAKAIASAVADARAAVESDLSGKISAAVEAERARASAIMSSEHFAGREALGNKMIAMGMSAKDAVDLLSASPKEKSSNDASASAQAAAIEQLANAAAEVGPDVSEVQNPAKAAAKDGIDEDALAAAKAFAAARRGVKR